MNQPLCQIRVIQHTPESPRVTACFGGCEHGGSTCTDGGTVRPTTTRSDTGQVDVANRGIGDALEKGAAAEGAAVLAHK